MNKFGGEWTKQKLDVLQDYLNFYMTALKNKPFKKYTLIVLLGVVKLSFLMKLELMVQQ